MTPIPPNGYIAPTTHELPESGILTISDDLNQALVPLIETLGTPIFYEHLGEIANTLTGSESCLIARFSRDGSAAPLYHNLTPDLEASSITPYFAGAFLLDPFYTLFQSDAKSGVHHLQDCAPDDFRHSEYYRSYYLNTELVEEIGILLRISPNACTLISCGNRGDPKLNNILSQTLEKAIPLMTALCRKQDELNASPPLQRPLDIAFRNFGKDYLSNREREVVQLILKGHSNKSIANLLEISLDTVKVYNKRFHTKLAVSSQAELFSLFLEAVSTAPLDDEADPLTHLGLDHSADQRVD